MVRTLSTMLPLGTPLPPFELPVVQGTGFFQNSELSGLEKINNEMLPRKPILLMIICAHCPFVKHVEMELTKLDKDYGDRVYLLAISSNSLITHPEDGPENLARQSMEKGWNFPYLLDLEQSFAKALRAACTPEFFLFSSIETTDNEKLLRYRGQLDDSRPGNKIPVSGKDLRLALNAVLDGGEVSHEQKPSIGCNIKWHPGKEPSWFN